jgi:hypothetical protein
VETSLLAVLAGAVSIALVFAVPAVLNTGAMADNSELIAFDTIPL